MPQNYYPWLRGRVLPHDANRRTNGNRTAFMPKAEWQRLCQQYPEPLARNYAREATRYVYLPGNAATELQGGADALAVVDRWLGPTDNRPQARAAHLAVLKVIIKGYRRQRQAQCADLAETDVGDSPAPGG